MSGRIQYGFRPWQLPSSLRHHKKSNHRRRSTQTTRNIEKAALCHCLVTIILHRVLLWCAALRRILSRLVGTPTYNTSPEGLLAQLHPIERVDENGDADDDDIDDGRLPLQNSRKNGNKPGQNLVSIYLWSNKVRSPLGMYVVSPCVALLSRPRVLALSLGFVLVGIFFP